MPDMTTRVPSNRKLTDEEIALLSGIFRVILKEIRGDEDKHNLAPGEPGIDYETGVMYVRNPHTGNLITPNGLEQMRMMMRHFDAHGDLNSEYLRDLALYTNLADLPEPLPNTTPDTVISHMTHIPSVFVGPIESDSVSWPSKKGTLIVVKFDEETVMIRYFDAINNAAYYGIYNAEDHLFDGWNAYYVIGPFTKVTDDTEINVELDIGLEDLATFTVKLVNGLQANASVILNGSDSKAIVDRNGNPIDYPIAENNSIMLIYDEFQDAWVLNDSGDSATLAGVDILRRRISSLNQDVLDLADSTTTRIEELSNSVDQRFDDLELEVSSKFSDVYNNIDTIDERVDNLETNSATKTELAAAKDELNGKFSNFDAAWVKSINGSKLPLDVIPEGALERLYIVPRLSVLADSSAAGYPTGASNGDTIKDQSDGQMYYITNAAILGTSSYGDGIEVYTAGSASYVEWANVDGKPTTLAGYGITDAVDLSTYRSLQERVTELEAEVTALTTTVNDILSNPGNLDVRFTNYTAIGGESVITDIENFDPVKDKLFVNYGQTILKSGIDYRVTSAGIRLLETTLTAGDVVQFIIFKQ